MPIKITATTEGFRRGGIAHPKGETTYPDGTFTKAQLAALKAEPMLTVQEIADPEAEKAAAEKKAAEKAAKEKVAADKSDKSDPSDKSTTSTKSTKG